MGDFINQLVEIDFMAEIIVAVLAFMGAYLGTKTIKRHLIDNYVEARVKKALEVNDNVLSKARGMLSDLEQNYRENRPISDDDLDDLIEKCKEIAKVSEDGGKEVSTVAYLLYQIVEDLKPVSKTTDSDYTERLTTRSVVGLIDRSLRLIVEYCNSSTPIPFKPSLEKRSDIKWGLRKYLSDKKHYSLKHQPFGLTLNPNSEVILRYSAVVGEASTSLFRRNLFMFLQSNLPIIYELLVGKIYMPIVLGKEDGFELFGKEELHLIKVQSIRRIGDEGGDYFDFYYSNISPRLKFVDGYKWQRLQDEFLHDTFIQKSFSLHGFQRVERRPNETIKITVKSEWAKYYFKKYQWSVRLNLLKQRIRH